MTTREYIDQQGIEYISNPEPSSGSACDGCAFDLPIAFSRACLESDNCSANAGEYFGIIWVKKMVNGIKLKTKTKTKTIFEKLEDLEVQKQKLIKSRDRVRANKTFGCVCGATHKIKDCVGIQEHWYESPWGCTGGASWHSGELNILCPDNEYRNRLWFDSNNKVPYDTRDTYEYSARMQFQHMYRSHLKSIIDDYGDNKFKWANNTYIDKNRKKFGISINGLDT